MFCVFFASKSANCVSSSVPPSSVTRASESLPAVKSEIRPENCSGEVVARSER